MKILNENTEETNEYDKYIKFHIRIGHALEDTLDFNSLKLNTNNSTLFERFCSDLSFISKFIGTDQIDTMDAILKAYIICIGNILQNPTIFTKEQMDQYLDIATKCLEDIDKLLKEDGDRKC